MRDHEQETGESPSPAKPEPGVFLPRTGWVPSCTAPGLEIRGELISQTFRLVVQESRRDAIADGDPQLSWSMLEQ